MNETFGTRLRLQRERQQVDLAAISASTKINLSLLERLERDDVEQWPVGIFRRAYVRAYASAIGLDPEAVLREFLERYPDPAPLDPFSAAEADEAAQPGGTRLGKIVRSAMAAVPGFMRQSRPELSRMHVAIDVADDRESCDHDEPVVPARATADRHEDLRAAAVAPSQPAEMSTRMQPGPPAVAAGHEAIPSTMTTDAQDMPRRREPDLRAAAALCTRFAQVREWTEVDLLLADAAHMLDAIGLVVWSRTEQGDALAAVLGQGYPPAVLARMPVVPRSADNALASAFRSARRSVVPSEDGRAGALVVPLLAAHGCAGVLALELTGGAEQSEAVAAFAEIVAAQLAPLLGAIPAAQAVSA